MKIICKYGFYKFFPDFVGEVLLWENKNDVKLFQREDYFTFESLAKFPNYSFKGQLLTSTIPASANFAGKPEEVMAKNRLTFNIKMDTITPRAIAYLQKLEYATGAFNSFPKLPQAFALDDNRKIITGFEAFCDVRLNYYKVERLFYEDI